MGTAQFYAPTRLVGCLVYDPNTLSFVEMTQPGAAGGGGAVTIADGANVAQGTTTDVAWVSGAGTVISLLKKIASAGGSAVSIADGSDVAQGTTTDVAVTSDAAGTLSAKLRGLVKIFASVWDSANGRLKVDGSAITQPVSSAGLTNLDVALSTRTKPTDQQHAIVDSGSLSVSNMIPAVETGLAKDNSLTTLNAKDFATQTTLALIKAKTDNLPADPAREGGVLATAALQSATQPRSITNFPAIQSISSAAGSQADLAALLAINQTVSLDLLREIRTELRVITEYLRQGLNVRDEPNGLRNDPSFVN